MLRRTVFRFIPKIMTGAEAVKDIPDGAVIGVGSFGYCGLPIAVMHCLAAAGPKNLHLIMGTAGGEDIGPGPLVKNGQLSKLTTTYIGENKVLFNYLMDGHCELELNPMGTLVDRLRAGGAGIPAFFTPTGYGTNVSEGGLPMRFANMGKKVTKLSPPKETRCINGRWCTYEEALRTDYSIIKAWKADKAGNVMFRGTTRNFNAPLATASKVTIAEVEEIVEIGQLDPNEIHLPGVYVHRLVCPPKYDKPVEQIVTRPRSGEVKLAGKAGDKFRQRIARRAAMELQDGMYVNLGIGVPMLVPTFMPPGVNITLQSENGVLGLGPYPYEDEVDPDVTNAGKQSATMNPGAALFDSATSFAMIRGGHMNVTMLGALQVSQRGDIASWIVPGKVFKGMGGAMDLVASGARVVVLMEHCAKDGTPRIVESCSIPLTGKGCVNVIVTDLAVFEVERDAGGVAQLVLTEVAEGVTVEEIRRKTAASFIERDVKPMRLSPVTV